MFNEIKGQWRIVLVTLLAANLVFMALLQLQRLEISRIFQKPSTEGFDFLAQELAEAKKTEIAYLDHIYRKLSELNIRVEPAGPALDGAPAPATPRLPGNASITSPHDHQRRSMSATAQCN